VSPLVKGGGNNTASSPCALRSAFCELAELRGRRSRLGRLVGRGAVKMNRRRSHMVARLAVGFPFWLI